MPQINGYEAARLIRGQPCGKDVLLVALTVGRGMRIVGKPKRAGFDHHFSKPVNVGLLRELIQSIRPALST